MRNLDTNVLEPAAAVLADSSTCKSHFTPWPWEDFKQDVRYFRNSNELEYRNRMQTDHGYNPPPVCTLVGHVLASVHAADVRFFRMLAALDLVLLVAMCLAVLLSARVMVGPAAPSCVKTGSSGSWSPCAC